MKTNLLHIQREAEQERDRERGGERVEREERKKCRGGAIKRRRWADQ